MQIIQVHPQSVSSNAGNRNTTAATIRKLWRCWSANEYRSWGENTPLFPPVKLFQFLSAEHYALKDMTHVQGQAHQMNSKEKPCITNQCMPKHWSLIKTHPVTFSLTGELPRTRWAFTASFTACSQAHVSCPYLSHFLQLEKPQKVGTCPSFPYN